MSFIDFLFGQRSFLGLDIGTTSVKVAEIARRDDALNLANYGILETYEYLERFNAALQTSNLKLSDTYVASYIKLLLSHVRPKTKAAVVSVPTFSVFSTLIEVPVATESEIKKFIEFQGSQYIPLPLNEVAVDWMRVGERRAEDGVTKQQVLLISIPNEQIERYKSICRAVGLRLVSIETEGVSAARVLGARAKEPTIIIDIGGRSTNFTIAQNGFMKYGGHTDFSGGSITQAIANGLGINQRRAEDLKRQRGVISSGVNKRELSTIILPILDVILYEAKRLITNYETNYHETVRSAVLTGGGANLMGIDAYFTEHFGFPVVKLDAFADIRAPQAISAISKNLSLSLDVAIGLGMKDFS